MAFAGRLQPAHRLLALFLAAALLPAVGLVWLGWRLLDQERELERQRVNDALNAAADQVTAGLERELSTLERSLPLLVESESLAGSDDALAVRLTPAGVVAHAGAPLLFTPHASKASEPPATYWLEAERHELLERDPGEAARLYRSLATTPDPSARAGWLMRLARVLRAAGRHEEALIAYDAVQAVQGGSIDGDPAGLVARWARLDLLTQLRRSKAAQEEAEALGKDLASGRWSLAEPAFDLYTRDLQSTFGVTVPVTGSARELSTAVTAIWTEWRERPRARAVVSQRRTFRVGATPVLMISRSEGDGLLLFVASHAHFADLWRTLQPPSGLTASMNDDSNLWWGDTSPSSAVSVTRHASETRLPWTVRLSLAYTPSSIASIGAARRSALWIGLVLLAILLPATTYLVWRAVQRDLQIARQQTDFVSAVSHEFRSPLTSLTHLTSLLRSGRPLTESRRQEYYEALARESERLRRFVETLLDFGRMQADGMQFRSVQIDINELAARVISEFNAEQPANRPPIRLEVPTEPAVVRGDPEALGRTLWNLLDNAVKYSPEGSPVRVEVTMRSDHLAIGVIDHGQGIPAPEQAHVFRRFYRGNAASKSVVKGTGIGLALVRQIVEAHGGAVELQSQEGAGSTFTIVLPACRPLAETVRGVS